MQWQDLLTGIAIMLIIEGILPFLSPDRLRRTLDIINQLDPKKIRMMGGLSMMIGLLILYFARS